MVEISERQYTGEFEKIFNWFHDNVHAGPESFLYYVNDLPGTHIKMVDIVRESTGGLYFRVILKATQEDVENAGPLAKNYKDLSYFNTKTQNAIIAATAIQVCYIQLDEKGIPIHGILYTYSAHDEKYHTFKINKKEKGTI
ncbi:MAG: hypothetical protein ABIR30_10040 [Chitinophagaceae bacterium]